MWRAFGDGTPDGMEEVARMCGRAAGTRGGDPGRARRHTVEQPLYVRGNGLGGGIDIVVSRQLGDGVLKC